ncbi:uncharacterized protein SETTUDRAFT_138482 [Exserohilum turcica Et28A]|uniref:Isochorismatase-like domain-containing protein n=1 Tax=Exserohilum turcicum (strain 28A) TaxID=671987 RepID=R0IFJ3_EXST2|nr:uncharacterized protein SETTUDRAFT_138482 [Exserohilum turcica Et28A]EOA83836.1 hypothetical protein SETTUDRAFT_138482 [Exserohilum turcica Et28A]
MAHHPPSGPARGLAATMGWGARPALLVVDVCKAYWSDGSPLDTSSNAAAAAVPAAIARLVAAARRGAAPLIWTRVEYSEPDMADAGLFACKAPLLDVFHRDDARGLGAWMPGLAPAPADVVVCKRYPSAFFATDLATRLRLASVDTLVICGVSTSGCVRATALDAMCLGFRPMVVGTACGDASPAVHDANLFDMNAKMADVIGEPDAVDRLSAGWP